MTRWYWSVRRRTIRPVRGPTIARRASARGHMSSRTSPAPRRSSGVAVAALIAFALVLLAGISPATGASAPVVTIGPRSSGAVALTFDDGWDRGTCRRIAQALRAHDVKGTFFVNG